MATRPRPPQPQPARSRSAKAQSVKARSAYAQSAKAKSGGPPADRPAPPGPAVPLPRELRVAAAIQAVDAAGLLVAAGLAAVATIDGKSYELSSGVALTLIAVATAALFAAFAAGLAKARPWTRTPVVMFQLAIGFWGVFLLTGHRYEWAIPMLALAAITLACIFTPASLRALNRPPRQP